MTLLTQLTLSRRVLNIRHMPGFKRFKPIISPGGIYIGRKNPRYRLPASKWFNPYLPDEPGKPRDGTLDEVLVKHEAWLRSQPALMACLPELRRRDLVCWCAPYACHGDLLLRLANAEGT